MLGKSNVESRAWSRGTSGRLAPPIIGDAIMRRLGPKQVSQGVCVAPGGCLALRYERSWFARASIRKAKRVVDGETAERGKAGLTERYG